MDAVANWINTCDGSPQNPTNVSRGIYGATVGIDRLLKLYSKFNIKATFFSPAHSIESFPKQLAKVRDAGHEIGLHGYTHEYVSQLSASEQKVVLDKSIKVLTEFCGKKPLGYTAPSWNTSRELIPQLEAAGIIYDHSFMHHDVQPYFAPDNSQSWVETDLSKPANAWMVPMAKLKASGVVEIPANWQLDDWPPVRVSLIKTSCLRFLLIIITNAFSCSPFLVEQELRVLLIPTWWRSCGKTNLISLIANMTRLYFR